MSRQINKNSQLDDKYKYGFVTDIDTDKAPVGLNTDIIKFISKKKNEPEWMLKWRLKAYDRLQLMREPDWAKVNYPKIDYQNICYYSAPKSNKDKPKSLDEIDPEILKTYDKLGIPLKEQEKLAGVAVDAVFDSVSVATTFKDKLSSLGVIFCPISEAIQNHPELVQKYLGSVIPINDHFFAALNSAMFTDGSFVYIPEGVRCPMELSIYFRINASGTGQFERTLIIADKGSYVSYLEGCTAPQRDENQLHAANVELIALDDAEIKKMMDDAESHKEDDALKQEGVAARNKADSLVYNTEKLLNENKDKLSEDDCASIEEALAETKKTLEDKDGDIEKINEAVGKLEQASHRLAEAMYQSQQAQASEDADSGSPEGEEQSQKEEDEVIDAEYVDVDEKK